MEKMDAEQSSRENKMKGQVSFCNLFGANANASAGLDNEMECSSRTWLAQL
jgi:hypothetical protein